MNRKNRPTYDLKAIGKKLNVLRKKKGLSVEEVCDYLGIASERTIYYYEVGERVPPFDVMFALMELYDANMEDVIGGEKAKKILPVWESDEECEKWLRKLCEITEPPINYEDCLNEEGKIVRSR